MAKRAGSGRGRDRSSSATDGVGIGVGIGVGVGVGCGVGAVWEQLEMVKAATKASNTPPYRRVCLRCKTARLESIVPYKINNLGVCLIDRWAS